MQKHAECWLLTSHSMENLSITKNSLSSNDIQAHYSIDYTQTMHISTPIRISMHFLTLRKCSLFCDNYEALRNGSGKNVGNRSPLLKLSMNLPSATSPCLASIKHWNAKPSAVYLQRQTLQGVSEQWSRRPLPTIAVVVGNGRHR